MRKSNAFVALLFFLNQVNYIDGFTNLPNKAVHQLTRYGGYYHGSIDSKKSMSKVGKVFGVAKPMQMKR